MANRQETLFDLAVVGGGINGVAIARDAAGRGLKVFLCEANDLGSATSSASSKLIHGGLRYLEHGQFGLVRESLREREILLRTAPHLVTPLQFLLPHAPGTRPAWMVRLGLFFYDTLTTHKRLGRSAAVDMAAQPEGAHLRAPYRKGFSYWDCWADDARLVIAIARDAAKRGAVVRPRTRCVSARREEQNWRLKLTGGETAAARALVNATGPWAGGFVTQVTATARTSPITLVKGSHIVVPRLFAGDRAFLLQNPDKRVIFVLPFTDAHHLIGTTDIPFEGDPATAKIEAREIDYLIAATTRYFDRPLSPSDIIWDYAGVRPLYGAGGGNVSKISRDYVLDLSPTTQGAPLLNVFGGKLTVHRHLAEQAVDRLTPLLGGTARPWTHAAVLPGGDFADRAALDAEAAARYPWLPAATRRRLVSAYGSEIDRATARVESGLGRHFGAGLYEAEIDYLRRNEWARTAEDILWRRSKLGLRVSSAEADALAKYLTSHVD